MQLIMCLLNAWGPGINFTGMGMKLSAQALDMGGVALSMYAGKVQFSSFLPIM